MRRRTVGILAVAIVLGSVAVFLTMQAGDDDGSASALDSSSSTTTVPTVTAAGPLTGTARTKTFDFDEASIQTGTGETSSVGMVELTIGDGATQSGARV